MGETMRFAFVLLALPLLTSCEETLVNRVRMPDGRSAYQVDCPASGGCQETIEEYCPGAYEILGQGGYAGATTAYRVGYAYVARSHDRYVIRFRCKSAKHPPPPAKFDTKAAPIGKDGEPAWDPWHAYELDAGAP